MSEIKVSIIIPVYNVEQYLEECITSVLRQEFSNYEIICVNDASTDRSGELLQAYAAQYEHIKVITHTENRGLSAARNTGLRYARGKYIWFVDSDDMITPDSLSKLYSTAERYYTDVLCFNITPICESDDRKNAQEEAGYQYEGVYSGKELFCLFAEDKKINHSACSRFLRKDFLEKEQISFYEGILHEDVLFSFLCSMKAKRVIALSQLYYHYRRRSGSITRSINYRRARSYFVVMVQILSFWTTHEFTKREDNAIGFCMKEIFENFQYYRCFTDVCPKLQIGGYPEQLLYELLYSKTAPKYLMLSAKQLDQLRQASSVVVYGAGRAAMDIVNTLQENYIKIDAIGVADTNANPSTFCGIQVDAIESISCSLPNATVIIGVTEKYSAGIQDKLVQLGYKDVITAEKPSKMGT